jgi:hypothetical protein
VDAVLATFRGSRAAAALATGDARRLDPLLARVRAAHADYWSL